MSYTILTLLLSIHVIYVIGSHFRGGIIMWKPTNNPNEVSITFRVSWRRDYDSNTMCDSTTIQNNNLIGIGSMTCFSGCSGTVGSMQFHCTDFSLEENWSAGERTFTYSFPETNSRLYEFGYSGNAWISVNNGGNNWILRTSADLNVRNDTGMINSSPKSAIQPIIRLQYGCNHTIDIPVEDADGDNVRCRWAVGFDECGGICSSFQQATLQERECRITYSATDKIGWYAVALQIEDYNSYESTQPLSSVPLQFLVQVFKATSLCADKPTFVEPTRVDGSCIGVPMNTTYFEPIISKTGANGISITEINTVSPPGMIKSELAQYQNDTRSQYVNITWEPSLGQIGQNIFCFTSKDSNGVSSDQNCVTLLGGVKPPIAVDGTQYPVGDILPTQNKWSIRFDDQFTRPNRTTYIYFKDPDTYATMFRVDVSGRLAQYPQGSLERTLTVTTNFLLTEKKHYYITLDPGVARGLTYCKAESPAIRNTSFWRIRIRDVTNPKLTFTSAPTVSNGTIAISWIFDEEVTSSCTIVKPDGVENIACDREWRSKNLTEGFYSIFIYGTDLEGNKADTTEHRWRVDKTPPIITIADKPHPITNDRNYRIKFSCNEECSIYCSLHEEEQSPYFVICSGSSSSVEIYQTRDFLEDRTYIFQIYALDVVKNRGNMVEFNWTTDFTPPQISDLNNLTVSCGTDISPLQTGSPNVTDNLPYDVQMEYKDLPSDQCGIIRKWIGTDLAGNIAYLSQVISFVSPNPLTIVFPSAAVIACGDIVEFTTRTKDYLETNIQHPCKMPFQVDHTDLDDPLLCGLTFTRTWVVSDTCGDTVTGTQRIQVLDIEYPVSPQTGQINVELRVVLRWSNYPAAINYHVFIWEYGHTKPVSPNATTTVPSYTNPKPFKSGTRYLWQIEIFIGQNKTIPTPKWGFETRKYPDLEIDSIILPPVAFSGQTFVVRWTVLNKGNGLTDQYNWRDIVYISFTENFNDARQSKLILQNNILLPGDGYTGETEVQLQANDFGPLSVFVKTDYPDDNIGNNLRKSDSKIDVKLTPPPDLQVDSIVTFDTVFSGSVLDVRYTVSNHGDGTTVANTWTDSIVWSQDENFDNLDTVLKSIRRNGRLLPGESYTTITSIMVPRKIFGNYSIIIQTDRSNEVYEHVHENNNIRSSETIAVSLTPPPDLEIKTFTTGESFVTGDTINIMWEVANYGSTAPYERFWWDRIILRSDSRADIVIGIVPHYSSLQPQDSYIRNLQYIIQPEVSTGSYSIQLDVDFRNNVFEYTNKQNNIMTKDIQILKAVPDFRVSHISVELFNGSKSTPNMVNITWTVENIGTGKNLVSKWIDRIFAIVGIEFKTYEYILQDVFIENKVLFSGDHYVHYKMIILPPTIHETVQFVVICDILNDTADADYANNRIVSNPSRIQLNAPDFSVKECMITSNEVFSGSEIQVKVTVDNIGSNIYANQSWQQNITIKEDEISDVLMVSSSTVRSGPLNHTDSYETLSKIQIPETFLGNFILQCFVNSLNQVYEGIDDERITNNYKTLPISIKKPPSPDLKIDSLQVSLKNNSSVENSLFKISWTVKNVGNSMSRFETWKDVIGISANANLNKSDINSQLEIIGSFDITHSLEATGSYLMEKTVYLTRKPAGLYYIYVVTDNTNRITEFDGEDNNVDKSSGIVFPKLPSPTLSLQDLKYSNSLSSPGSSAWIAYKMENTGEAVTSLSSWVDHIFASKDLNASKKSILKDGVLLKSALHVGSLEPGAFYENNVSIIVPRGLDGNQYIYVLSMDDENIDFSIEVSLQTSLNPANTVPVTVNQESLPDIFPTSDLDLGKQNGGQPFNFIYNVSNQGQEDTSKPFYNSFYLSEDYTLDPFDIKLNTQLISNTVRINETISSEVSLFLPFDLQSRNYFIIIDIDSRDDIYETTDINNIFVSSLSILQVFSTDLAVVDVKAPSNVAYGEEIQIDWKLRNNGSVSAKGYKCDTVFLSSDSTWDINDEQIGDTSCGFIDLEPYSKSNDESSSSLTSAVPPLSASSYSALVKSRSNILDSNLENNVGVASSTTSVSVTELQLNEESKVIFHGEVSKLFRIINVPAEETLIIQTSLSVPNSFYEIKIKHGQVATDFDFDVISENSLKSKRNIVIPNCKDGDYYMLISFNEKLPDKTELSILQKLAKFEIFSSSPNNAAPLGNVTVMVEGALFPENIDAELYNDTMSVKPLNIFRFSSTLLFLTFNVMYSQAGQIFSIRLFDEETKTNTSISDVLEIISGETGKIVTWMSLPGALRPRQTGLLYVDVENVGNTDVVVPFIVVKMDSVGHLKLLNDVKESSYKDEHILLAGPDKGPGGILPPGMSKRFIFEIKQKNENVVGRAGLEIFWLKPDNLYNHTYGQLKDVMKPDNVENEAWERIWQTFMSMTGDTWFSLNWKVSQILNQLSLARRRFQNLPDVIAFILDLAEGHAAEMFLSVQTDIEMLNTRDRHLTLDITRSFATKVSSRYSSGKMGKGWTLPYWSTKIKGINSFEANLTFDGSVNPFDKKESDVYYNSELGVIRKVLRNDSYFYQFTDQSAGITYVYSNSTGDIQSVQSLLDRSSLEFYYSGGQLQRIQHSDGHFILVKYDSRGRIVSFDFTDNIGSKQKSIYTYEDIHNRLLSSTVDGETTYYEYNSDNSIKSIQYPLETKEEFSYYEAGWLQSKTLITNDNQIARVTYGFKGDAEVIMNVSPSNLTNIYIYNEIGEVISKMQRGIATVIYESLSTGRRVYHGDALISKEMYDPNSMSVLVEDADGDFLNVSFDNDGRVKQVQDSKFLLYSVTYNTDKTIGSIKYPDATEESYKYTSDTTTFVRRSGAEIKYEFDDNKNMVSKEIGNSDTNTYSYDSKNRLKSCTNKDSVTNFGFTSNGLPLYTNQDAIFVNYTFNEKLIKTGIKLSLEEYDVKYEYNEMNLLTRVINEFDGEILLQIEYNEKSQMSKKILGNGAYSIYSYQSDNNLLTSIYNHFPDGNVSSKFEYAYDTRLRRIRLKTMQGDWAFRYDASGQVTYMRSPSGTVTEIKYDERKNRKVLVHSGQQQEYVVNDLNQYTRFDNKQSFDYDKNGNLIIKDGPLRREFEFNEENRLVGIKTPDIQCDLRYDALGNLRKKHCGENETSYIVDVFGTFGPTTLAEVNIMGDTTETTLYFHGGDQAGLIAMKSSNGYMYYQFDPVGSVISLLGEKGNLLNSYEYEPFGNILQKKSEVRNPFTYVGQWGVMEVEEISDLFYMRARFYDAEHGRFLSLDPIGINGNSKNLYAYAFNNPIHFMDPKGTIVPWVVAGLIGGTANTVFYLGYNLVTHQTVTWGGAAGSFVGGFVGWATGGASGAVNFAVQKVAPVLSGVFTKTLIDSGFGNEKFSWKKMGMEILSGIASSFLPGTNSTSKFRQILTGWRNNLFWSFFDPFGGFPIIKLGKQLMQWILSFDPNDMIGPSGFGAAHFIPNNMQLDFKIRFENMENATAPAQRVYVVHEFDNDIDSRTFKLGEFGFGDYKHSQDSSSFIQVTINLTESFGVFVRVRGGLDIVNNRATWEFQTVDPNTGLPPADPRKGFLPPNNGTTGQGYVTFKVRPKQNLQTMSRIDSQATIYFDQNEPIDTPPIFNTIDNTPPEISYDIIQELLESGILAVDVSTNDTGSGFKATDVLIKEDGGYKPLLTDVADKIINIPVTAGGQYDLLLSPADNVGNRHALDNIMVVNSFVINVPELTESCNALNNCSGNGNCTGNNVCICLEGFYGADCSQDTPAMEPPIIEAQNAAGLEDSNIPVYLSARAVNDFDNFWIDLNNFPSNWTYSNGTLVNGDLRINYNDFGQIYLTPPKDESGIFEMTVTAVITKNQKTSSRTGTIIIVVTPVVDDIAITGSVDCYQGNNSSVPMSLSIKQRDTDDSEVVLIFITLPEFWSLDGHFKAANGLFELSSADINQPLLLKPSTESLFPASVNITAQVSTSREATTKTFNKTLNIQDCSERFPVRIETVFDIDVKGDLSDKNSIEYIELSSKITQSLTQYYSTRVNIKDKFIEVVLHSLRKGSVIADYEVVTSTNLSMVIVADLTNLIESRGVFVIDNTTVNVLSAKVEGQDIKISPITTLSPKDTDSSGDHTLGRAAIIAIVVSSLLAFVLFVCIVIALYRKSNNRKSKFSDADSQDHWIALPSSSTTSGRKSGFSPL